MLQQMSQSPVFLNVVCKSPLLAGSSEGFPDTTTAAEPTAEIRRALLSHARGSGT